MAILIVAYLRSQVFKGNDARRKADLKRIGVAVEEYEKDKNCYPLPSLLTCNPGKGLLLILTKSPVILLLMLLIYMIMKIQFAQGGIEYTES